MRSASSCPLVVILAVLGAGCGPSAGPATPATTKTASKPRPAAMITPSRLVPELDTSDIEPWFEERGRSRYLLGGLRIVQHDGGRIERADERFPRGDVHALPLPDRLGGGFVFYQSDGQGTRLWRAKDWTAKLEPLAHLNPEASDVVPGFDRLYLRTAKSNKLMALDVDTGAILSLGQLPLASAYGAMAFADGWRAVVDTDLVGPLASFDAGASWHPLGVDEAVVSAQVEGGDPVLYVDRGSYRVDARGHVQFIADTERTHAEGSDDDDDTDAESPEHPLGDRPLRVAIEHGYPDSATTAVVVYRGALVRVRLPEGEVVAHAPRALPHRDAQCTGVKLGRGIGFVCGALRDDTVVYRVSQSLLLTEVARFSGPRFVAASGNGALVVRGSCAGSSGSDDEASAGEAASSETRAYCIVGIDGSRREIAVRGELGAERVVALGDGRVVVLVPPRLGQPGKLNIIAGSKLTEHELVYPADQGSAVEVARRGLWLEGFEQHGDAIRGWVEAGGPVVGVRIALDGKVSLGEPYKAGGEVLMSGRFALAVGDAERARESLDGGKTWREVELPELPKHAGDAKTRACTPVGCALRGWLRVGWGKPAVKDDLQVVSMPDPVGVKAVAGPTMALSCSAVGEANDRGGPPSNSWSRGNWDGFLGGAPPKLAKGEVGVDVASQPYSEVPSHVYVWGPKGADWARTGWWQIRWDDRFARGDGIRETAPTRPPWADEVGAAEAIGSRRGSSYWRWETQLEPSGEAALMSHCTSGACNPYAVSRGRPITRLRSPQGGAVVFRKPLEHGVARIGESWYVLSADSGAAPLALWRASLGVMRTIAVFRRLDGRLYPNTSAPPRLVRRRLGNEIGLLLEAPADPSSGEKAGTWMVLPIDTNDGSLAEPVMLGRVDLEGRVPPACRDQHDGWLLETELSPKPNVTLTNANGYLDDIEMRLVLEPGSACIEAIAAKAGRGFRSVEGKEGAPASDDSIAMSASERYAGRRWNLRCVAAR